MSEQPLSKAEAVSVTPSLEAAARLSKSARVVHEGLEDSVSDTLLARDLRRCEDPSQLLDFLRSAFTDPQRLITTMEWHSGGTASYFVEQIYKWRKGNDTAGALGQAASMLLREWTPPPTEASAADAARGFLVFLAYAKPPELRGMLNTVIDDSSSSSSDLDWFARLLTVLQDYELLEAKMKSATVRQDKEGAEPDIKATEGPAAVGKEERPLSFWEDHLRTFEAQPKYASVVWSGIIRLDKNRAFELLPQITKNSEATDSIVGLFAWVVKRIFGGDMESFRSTLSVQGPQLSEAAKTRINLWFRDHQLDSLFSMGIE